MIIQPSNSNHKIDPKLDRILFALTALVIVLVSILVYWQVYPTIDQVSHPSLRTSPSYWQEIETPGKKLLNGYLGIFFRFKSLSNINWLIVPLLIWFLVTAKKRERWQLALMFVWLVTLIFIGVKGYTNNRYQLTLFPFTSAATLFLLWQFLENKKKTIRVIGLSLVALVCVFNIYHYFNLYQNWWEIRVSVKDPHFPRKIINYLNLKQDFGTSRENVYTFNQPIFYYHTKRRGIDASALHVVPVQIQLKSKSGPHEPVFDFLSRKLRVEYLLLGKNYKQTNRRTLLEEFLQCECKLVMEDNDWLLYRLRRKLLDEEIQSPGRRLINVWDETQSSVQTISPALSFHAQCGTFTMEPYLEDEGNGIVVQNTGKENGKDPWLQFGYDLGTMGLTPAELEGKYVSLVIRAAVTPAPSHNKNYVAIMDYNQTEKVNPKAAVFNTRPFRTYFVSNMIRPNLKKTEIMFNFVPRSPKDKLIIRDVKIVISNSSL
ncbi:MAG: hypothetical protein ACM3SY_15885 [Candidatus Omnitrophota bacterium]